MRLMRHRLITILGVCAAVALISPLVAAQGGSGGRGAPVAPDTRPFNPRELSGIWRGSSYGFNATSQPPMTPEGQKRFDGNKPSYGSAVGSPAAANTKEPSGRRRAVPPALGNDYVGTCNPLGLMRALLYSPSPMEIIQIPDRVLMHFEWTWDHREIWTDGRPLPTNVEDYILRFNGYSVGRWDGDVFVVDTVGLDDRQWVDHFGYPISARARLQERWRRTSFSTLELTMTLTDPGTYTMPWTSDVSTFRLVPKENSTIGGWTSILEDRCVPLDEVEQFNTRIRNPAGGVK